MRLLRNSSQRPQARRLLLAAVFLFWTLAISTAPTRLPNAIAAPIATPTPGAGVLLTAPAPDPAQFDFAQQQVLPHTQLNANFYGLWDEFTALIGALNATGAGAYACGPCITGLTNGTGISATLGSQVAGGGVTATIALSHGDYIDTAAAQSISGNKTFNGSTSFNQPIVVAGNGAASAAHIRLQDTTNTTTAPNKYIRANGTNGNLEILNSADASVVASISDAGNVTAANFFTGSRREWKRNIRPIGFDAIAMLRDLDLARYDCADPRCGPIGMTKIGYIANNAPAVLSGPKHDHFDAGALATVDAAAIRQLASQVEDLRAEINRLKRHAR